MFELGKCILVTNSDRAAEKRGDSMNHIFTIDTYEEVLKKVGDLIHTEYRLLVRPQASNLKSNQASYRIVLLYDVQENGKAKDVCLIENALKTYEKWSPIKKILGYGEETAYDYKATGLPIVENVIPRLQGTDCSD